MSDRTLEIRVTCELCRKEFTILVRPDDYDTFCSSNRPYIQDIFPYLTAGERELLLSSVCNECWDNLFPEE